MTTWITKVPTAFALVVSLFVSAQDLTTDPVTLHDFADMETDAPAVYLVNEGETRIHYYEGQGWVARTSYHRRIRILTKEGLDYANVEVRLYRGDREVEQVEDIQATTYNIDYDAGTFVTTAMEKDAIFSVDQSERWRKVSFSLPQVRVNSVLDISYVKVTPFIFNLDDWYFQHDIPVKRSRYDMVIPGFHQYVFSVNGYLAPDTSSVTVNPRKQKLATYEYRNLEAFWEMTDVPPFREEAFMTTKEDYVSKLEFQLQAIVFPDREDTYLKSWEEVSKDMMDDSRFKSFYKRKDKFEDVPVVKGDDLTKAKVLYDYFHSHFKWNERFGTFPDVNIAQFTRNREGNSSALGLAMYNLMNQEGLQVQPVLFSPRFNGRINYDYPFQTKLICTVVKLEVDGEIYLLDPVSDMPFGYLNKQFLLDRGLVLGDEVEWIDMYHNSYEQLQSTATVQLTGSKLQAQVTNHLSDYGVTKVDVDNLAGVLESDWQVDSVLLRDRNPSEIQFDYYLSQEVEDDLVLVPIVHDGLILRENPFLAEERLYPVDFYFKKKFSFQMTLEIEDDYEIESLPETQMVRSPLLMTVLNVNKLDDQKVQVALVHWVKANAIGPEHYPKLREAYELLAGLKNSVIVLRKKT